MRRSMPSSRSAGLEPATADSGFFQPAPELRNQFGDDVAFQQVAKCKTLLLNHIPARPPFQD